MKEVQRFLQGVIDELVLIKASQAVSYPPTNNVKRVMSSNGTFGDPYGLSLSAASPHMSINSDSAQQGRVTELSSPSSSHIPLSYSASNLVAPSDTEKLLRHTLSFQSSSSSSTSYGTHSPVSTPAGKLSFFPWLSGYDHYLYMFYSQGEGEGMCISKRDEQLEARSDVDRVDETLDFAEAFISPGTVIRVSTSTFAGREVCLPLNGI